MDRVSAAMIVGSGQVKASGYLSNLNFEHREQNGKPQVLTLTAFLWRSEHTAKFLMEQLASDRRSLCYDCSIGSSILGLSGSFSDCSIGCSISGLGAKRNAHARRVV